MHFNELKSLKNFYRMHFLSKSLSFQSKNQIQIVIFQGTFNIISIRSKAHTALHNHNQINFFSQRHFTSRLKNAKWNITNDRQ